MTNTPTVQAVQKIVSFSAQDVLSLRNSLRHLQGGIKQKVQLQRMVSCCPWQNSRRVFFVVKGSLPVLNSRQKPFPKLSSGLDFL